MDEDKDAERLNRAEGLGTLLNTHLQQLGARRAAMSEEERNKPPALYVVPQMDEITPAVPRIPATPEQIIKQLAMLDIVFPSQSLSPDERSLRYQIYCVDLGDMTEAELIAACAEYRKDPQARFFPTPGQILEVRKWQRILRHSYPNGGSF